MKTLKRIGIAALVIAMTMTVCGNVWAKNGNGQGNGTGVCINSTSSGGGQALGSGNGKGNGMGNGSGPIVDIFAGEAVTIEGTVSGVNYYGQGIEIDTGEEVVTVYGLGPVRYWDSLEIARPAVGDEISVDGYNVTFSDGTTKIIAVTVTVDDGEVALRDAETGAPLWRGGNR